jgi:hypothetical protein
MDEAEDRRGAAQQARHASHPRSGQMRRSRPDAALDEWLQHGLRAMFDNVTQEPVPDELLQLIEQADK